MVVKLFVFFVIFKFVLCSVNFCEICPNHTLCKYTMPGASTTCKDYDAAALLTKNEIVKIINRINERRNFVAKGLAKHLPQAANMEKIRWSEELAAFAQRWVDQCEQSTRSDKEDECRDLADAKVGQNIASVTGSTPGMHIESLIDVWYTMGTDYKGSAAFYNRNIMLTRRKWPDFSSQDWKTNYFTQLIWGETDRVGCGRAKFFAENKNTMIDRLVCNFAPKGNNYGKPVYAIGYPATQCKKDMEPDREFNGLCSHIITNEVSKFTPYNPPVSSLLRILNLSHNSSKQEIDPVGNNLGQVKAGLNQTNDQRNQKTRHVFFNGSHVRNIPPMPMYNNKWRNPVNISRNQRIQQYQQERGHSRVYHGHDLHENNFRSEVKQTANQNFRKFDFSTKIFETTTIRNENFRKNYQGNECTRGNVQTGNSQIDNGQVGNVQIGNAQMGTNQMGNNQMGNVQMGNVQMPIAPEIKNEGSRRQNIMDNCMPLATPFHPPPVAEVYFQNANPVPVLCPCIPTTTCPPPPPRCGCNINCQCLETDCSQPLCPPGLRRSNDAKAGETTPSEFHYYDLLPKLAVRSGESDSRRFHSKDAITPSSKDLWPHSTTMGNILKHFPHTIQDNYHENIKDLFPYENSNKPDSDYIYDSSDSRERKRRNPADEMTFKPFWQMDEFNNQKSGQLKSIKFTTLQRKKTKRITTRIRPPQTTEIITVNLKDGSNTVMSHKNIITEKYLSFDELMHLRKFGPTETSTIINARRQSNESVTTALKGTTPSEYTTNTPFKRKKYCTRKLTCTWTGITITDSSGSVIGGPGMGGGAERGSRTPPGYVEGCTRTSTCTREFMDRNKFSTIRDGADDDGGSGAGSGDGRLEDDEDYCEKRALNVQRRDSNEETTSYPNADTLSKTSFFVGEQSKVTYISNDMFTTTTPIENCLCLEDNHRIKRNKDKEPILDRDTTVESHKEKRSSRVISYGNLYYLVLQKIIDTWQRKHNSNSINPCLCNSSCIIIKGSVVFITFMFVYNIIINYYR